MIIVNNLYAGLICRRTKLRRGTLSHFGNRARIEATLSGWSHLKPCINVAFFGQNLNAFDACHWRTHFTVAQHVSHLSGWTLLHRFDRAITSITHPSGYTECLGCYFKPSAIEDALAKPPNKNAKGASRIHGVKSKTILDRAPSPRLKCLNRPRSRPSQPNSRRQCHAHWLRSRHRLCAGRRPLFQPTQSRLESGSRDRCCEKKSIPTQT